MLARPVLIQAIAYVLGFGVLLFIQNLDYRFFIGLEKVLYVISILLLLTVYVPGLGQENYGSRAWISLGITTLQLFPTKYHAYFHRICAYFLHACRLCRLRKHDTIKLSINSGISAHG